MATRRPRMGYRESLAWLLDNDDTEWLNGEPDSAMASPAVTACLLADIFGHSTDEVRRDLLSLRNRRTLEELDARL